MSAPVPRAPRRHPEGVTLVEVLVGLIIFSIAMLGLAAGAQLALVQAGQANTEVQLWAAVQRTADSLVAVGPGSVTGGSHTVDGIDLSWRVTGSSPERIELVYSRGGSYTRKVSPDTLVLYLSQ